MNDDLGGKSENLVFILDGKLCNSNKPSFINYCKKFYKEKRWETIRNLGKIYDFQNILLMLSVGQRYAEHLQDLVDRDNKGGPPYYFITINPPPNSIRNFTHLDEILLKINSLKLYSEMEYCIEQRSSFPILKEEYKDNTYIYQGIHAHIVLLKQRGAKPFKVKADFIRVFKTYGIVLPPFNKHSFQLFSKGNFYHEKRRYLRGDKGNDSFKDAKVEIDVLIREWENLDPFFSSL